MAVAGVSLQKGAMLFRRAFDFRETEDFDTERAQSYVRVIVIFVIALYICATAWAEELPAGAWVRMVLLYGYFIPFSLLLMIWIVRRPGVNWLRRGLSMTHDYAAMTVAMATGGAALTPIAAALLCDGVDSRAVVGHRYHDNRGAIKLSAERRQLGLDALAGEKQVEHKHAGRAGHGAGLMKRVVNGFRGAYRGAGKDVLDQHAQAISKDRMVVGNDYGFAIQAPLSPGGCCASVRYQPGGAQASTLARAHGAHR